MFLSKSLMIFSMVSCMLATSVIQGLAQSVVLNPLGGAVPGVSQGVSWGVPFAQGAVSKSRVFTLTTANNTALPLQTWPLAYWPDGSIKWLGCATVLPSGTRGPVTLEAAPATIILGGRQNSGPSALAASPVVLAGGSGFEIQCKQEASGISVNTGAMQCLIPSKGTRVVEQMSVNGKVIASQARLVCSLEQTSRAFSTTTAREEEFEGQIERITLEQSGPVRAVVKIEGKHYSQALKRAWLPFVLRLYFYAGETSVKAVHSFVFDGDGNKDFINSLGLQFTVPFRDEEHNRHVRFSGEATDGSGFWVQPVRLMPGYRPSAGEEVTTRYAEHLAGKPVPALAGFSERSRAAILTCPVWGDMRLLQTGPNGFSIDKRTQGSSSWLHVTDGYRSLGGALLGDASGSIFAGIRDFWQKYPSALEVRNAGTPEGTLSLWFWAPAAEAMDLRSYDTLAHDLNINYEDWKPGWATPEGIANTNELNIRLFGNIPDAASLLEVAKATQQPLQLVCTPEYYHSVRALGIWGLPDKSNPVHQAVEAELDRTISYLQKQVEQRYWYGFWNYGDIMHNYDFGRHEWRYDIGGWAWNNTELMPDMFLWISFLRTGRADIWKMAEAMTRHTSEADVHHLGRFAPLGSRHNVTHWGDGAKQPRISHAGLKRYYYYLTTDERTGDLMREQLRADSTYDEIKRNDTRNPVSGTYISHGFGTDWCSYAINWMTEWERTGNTYWRDRILNGVKDMLALGRNGLPSSGGLYNITTGRFMTLKASATQAATGARGSMNAPASDFAPAADVIRTTPSQDQASAPAARRMGGGPGYFDMIFGAPEIMAELLPMLNYEPFREAWLKVCQSLANTTGNQMTGPRMAAWAYHLSGDTQMGELAWKQLLDNTENEIAPGSSLVPGTLVSNPGLLHPVEDPIFLGRSAGWQLHNPSSMQWALNALEVMEMAKKSTPASVPAKYKNSINY
jgi:hypothetical protein